MAVRATCPKTALPTSRPIPIFLPPSKGTIPFCSNWWPRVCSPISAKNFTTKAFGPSSVTWAPRSAIPYPKIPSKPAGRSATISSTPRSSSKPFATASGPSSTRSALECGTTSTAGWIPTTHLRCQVHTIELARAYIERIVLEQFVAVVKRTSPELQTPLKWLCDLYALHTIEGHKGWYLEQEYLRPSKTKAIRRLVVQRCREVRHEAASLTAAFAIPEESIAAPIARRAMG
ncbi:MAG: acyl-CoA dehydrogenase [Bacteroidota bacterium]